MQQFLDSIRQSVSQENWFGALFMALAIPDICGKLDPSMPSGNQKRYKAWAQKYLCPKYVNKINDDVFWKLRNSCFHEGTHVERGVKTALGGASLLLVIPQESPFHDSDVTLVSGESYVHLRIDVFCEDVCDAIEQWLNDVAGNQAVQQEIATLLHLTGDPSQAHQMILGNLSVKWVKHSIRGLFSDLPQRKGFSPHWLRGGRIPDGVTDMLGNDAEKIVRQLLEYQIGRRNLIRDDPDAYVRCRIGELENALKTVTPTTPSNPNNTSMYDHLLMRKKEYDNPDERPMLLKKEAETIESYIQELHDQLRELTGRDDA